MGGEHQFLVGQFLVKGLRALFCPYPRTHKDAKGREELPLRCLNQDLRDFDGFSGWDVGGGRVEGLISGTSLAWAKVDFGTGTALERGHLVDEAGVEGGRCGGTPPAQGRGRLRPTAQKGRQGVRKRSFFRWYQFFGRVVTLSERLGLRRETSNSFWKTGSTE